MVKLRELMLAALIKIHIIMLLLVPKKENPATETKVHLLPPNRNKQALKIVRLIMLLIKKL